MTTQNYKNHARYYIPHHFVFYPLAIVALVYCIWASSQKASESTIWILVAVSFFLIIALSFMVRQHYALTVQNRIIRLELRFRYYILTHRRFEPLEKQLAPKQVYALRFASDEELVALVQRTLAEQLSPAQIKKSISNWLPDESRV